MLPVYILIRTSGRPRFFSVMMGSIKEQTYQNITTIVYSDDPEDTYVTGDIILHGERLPYSLGTAPYNLYNNELLKAIPDEPGYFCFIDDDDCYYDCDVIEKLVTNCKENQINVARTMRWGETVFPKHWKKQSSFQTECFMLHTKHKNLGTWWANKGGDHYYTKQIAEVLQINWIEDLIICKAQEGKGHGRRHDIGEMPFDERMVSENKQVPVLYLDRVITPQTARGRQGEVKMIIYRRAKMLENKGHVRILSEGIYKQFIQSGRNMEVIYAPTTVSIHTPAGA